MALLASGHTAHELEEEVALQYKKDMPGGCSDVFRLQPEGWIVTKRFMQFQEKIYNFKFRPDDVLVMTYPKCGTTWMQEIVWTMRKNPDLDSPDVGDALFVRSPYIEMDMLFVEPSVQPMTPDIINMFLAGYQKYCPNPDLEAGIALQIAEGHEGGRTLKSHLSFPLLPEGVLDTCKVVYVARNPKDNFLSAQHHYRRAPFHKLNASQDVFIDYYTKGLLLYGAYDQHVRQAWRRRQHPNMHIVFFEDLKADFMGELKKLDSFIGTNLTQKQMENVQKQTSFESLKKNERKKIEALPEEILKELPDKDSSFFREGKAGAWEGKFTTEENAKLDDWITKSFTGPDFDGFNFKYK